MQTDILNEKVFAVDYFLYSPSSQNRKIYTYLLGSSSRKTAEQATRELEKGNKITIVKIQSFSINDIINHSVEDEYANN